MDGDLAQPEDQHRARREAVAAGGEADPAAAGAAKLAGRASRVNTFFSIPMLFFMVFTTPLRPELQESGRVGGRHLDPVRSSSGPAPSCSALGKLPGGLDSPFCKMVLDNHIKTIEAGIVAVVVLYFIGWELVIGGIH